MNGSGPGLDDALDRRLASSEMLVDPYPTYALLREQPQPAWSDGLRGWVVSRFADVGSSLQDDRLSNEERQELLFAELTDAERDRLAPLRHYFAQRDIIASDPPDHGWMRAIVQKAFTPRVVESLTDRIRSLTRAALDEARRSGPTFDFVRQIAHPVPVTLIAEVLGAPVEDRPQFRRWSADILGFQGTGRTSFAAASVAQTSLLEMFAYMSALIEDRRRAPRDDIITTLSQAEDGSHRLDRDQLLATCNTLLTAGHETTTNLLGNLVHLVLRDGDAWDRIVADRSLIPGAIEEALRYDAPKQRNFRRVQIGHRLGDATLSEGEMVFQLVGAANRDPAAFPDPDRFEIGRGRSGHLAFGKGIHFCLGAPLARLESRIVLETLVDQAPRLSLEGQEVVWQQRVQFRGPGALLLRF